MKQAIWVYGPEMGPRRDKYGEIITLLWRSNATFFDGHILSFQPSNLNLNLF